MNRLAKDDTIQAILQLNPTAAAAFLDGFETTELAAYLVRLRGAGQSGSTFRREKGHAEATRSLN